MIFVRWMAAITIGIMNVLDIITTWWVLDHGGIETNPLAKLMIEYRILIPFKLAIVALILWGTWMTRTEKVGLTKVIVPCIVALIYLGVVTWNVSRILVHLT